MEIGLKLLTFDIADLFANVFDVRLHIVKQFATCGERAAGLAFRHAAEKSIVGDIGVHDCGKTAPGGGSGTVEVDDFVDTAGYAENDIVENSRISGYVNDSILSNNSTSLKALCFPYSLDKSAIRSCVP